MRAPFLFVLAVACVAPVTTTDDTDGVDTDETDTVDTVDTVETDDTDLAETDDTDLAETDDTDLPETDETDDTDDTDVSLPDADGDGVLDGDDACPSGATGWTSNGTTDADGDGCRDADEDLDDDDDGSPDSADCEDLDPSIYPGAPEACGEERDCDGGTVAACDWGDVWPIFRSKCTPCHSGNGSGGHNMAGSNIATAYDDSQLSSYYASGNTKGYAALVRIQNGTMPVGRGCTGNPVTDAADPDCLSAAQQAVIQAWLDNGQQE